MGKNFVNYERVLEGSFSETDCYFFIFSKARFVTKQRPVLYKNDIISLNIADLDSFIIFNTGQI